MTDPRTAYEDDKEKGKEKGKEKFQAYWYEFEATGITAVDAILDAVARAGKAYHNTEMWGDSDYQHDGETFADVIQRHANNGAAEVAQLKATCDRADEVIAGLEKKVAKIDRLLDADWSEWWNEIDHGAFVDPYDSVEAVVAEFIDAARGDAGE